MVSNAQQHTNNINVLKIERLWIWNLKLSNEVLIGTNKRQELWIGRNEQKVMKNSRFGMISSLGATFSLHGKHQIFWFEAIELFIKKALITNN